MLAMPKERSLVPSRRPLHSSSARPRSTGSARARSHGQTPLSHATARRRSVKEQRVGGKAPVSLGSGLGLGAFGGDAANGARPPEGGTLLTRRRFLYGAAAVGAAGILAAGGAAIANVVGDGEGNSGDVPTLTVPGNAVTTLSADSENFSQTADDAPLVQNAGAYDLPFGTLLWSSNDVNAACLIPTSGANPLTTVGIMNLSTGGVTTVLEQARDQAAGFDIYDVRCSQTGMVWTEANILQGVWRVWAAPLSVDGALGSPIQLDEGDSAWETPSIAAAGDAAFWQCLPKANGVAATANSCVKRAAFGSSEVGTVYESEGRMATPLYALADAVVCTPRAATSGTYYQLTCLDAASGTVTDQVTLPASMRPLEAGYGPTGFSFCFEAAYNYGDGIAGVGTYTPLSEGTSFDYEGTLVVLLLAHPYDGARLVRRLLRREVHQLGRRRRPCVEPLHVVVGRGRCGRLGRTACYDRHRQYACDLPAHRRRQLGRNQRRRRRVDRRRRIEFGPCRQRLVLLPRARVARSCRRVCRRCAPKRRNVCGRYFDQR